METENIYLHNKMRSYAEMALNQISKETHTLVDTITFKESPHHPDHFVIRLLPTDADFLYSWFFRMGELYTQYKMGVQRLNEEEIKAIILQVSRRWEVHSVGEYYNVIDHQTGQQSTQGGDYNFATYHLNCEIERLYLILIDKDPRYLDWYTVGIDPARARREYVMELQAGIIKKMQGMFNILGEDPVYVTVEKSPTNMEYLYNLVTPDGKILTSLETLIDVRYFMAGYKDGKYILDGGTLVECKEKLRHNQGWKLIILDLAQTEFIPFDIHNQKEPQISHLRFNPQEGGQDE